MADGGCSSLYLIIFIIYFVTDFKFLGITIDDRRNFRKQIANIIKKVNPKPINFWVLKI